MHVRLHLIFYVKKEKEKLEVIFWGVGEELLLVLVIIIQNDYTGGAQNLFLPFMFLFCYYYFLKKKKFIGSKCNLGMIFGGRVGNG